MYVNYTLVKNEKIKAKNPSPQKPNQQILSSFEENRVKKNIQKKKSLNVKECEEQRSKRRSGMREHVCTFIEAGQGSPC